MAQKNLFLVRTAILYEVSKWWKIKIRKPITDPQNMLKGNGLSVIYDLKPGLCPLCVVTMIRAETMPESVIFG